MAPLSVAEARGKISPGRGADAGRAHRRRSAHGRVLADGLVARLTQPPFDASAMDGYAVRSADLRSLPTTLELIGEAAGGASLRRHAGAGAGRAHLYRGTSARRQPMPSSSRKTPSATGPR